MKIETYAEVQFDPEDIKELKDANYILRYVLARLPEQLGEFSVGGTTFNYKAFHTDVYNTCKYIDAIIDETETK